MSLSRLKTYSMEAAAHLSVAPTTMSQSGVVNGAVDKNASSKSTGPKRPVKRGGARTTTKDLDFDSQCGVLLPNGLPCGRSLTCKTHSMASKRAVVGRSQPFDVLISSYQKRRQVKQSKRSAMAKNSEEIAAAAAADAAEPVLPENEEIQQVMLGAARSQAIPLARRTVMPVRARTDYFRLRELLLGSIARVPPLPVGHTGGLAKLMTSTGGVLGRAIVYNPVTGASDTRPARTYRPAR